MEHLLKIPICCAGHAAARRAGRRAQPDRQPAGRRHGGHAEPARGQTGGAQGAQQACLTNLKMQRRFAALPSEHRSCCPCANVPAQMLDRRRRAILHVRFEAAVFFSRQATRLCVFVLQEACSNLSCWHLESKRAPFSEHGIAIRSTRLSDRLNETPALRRAWWRRSTVCAQTVKPF